MIRKELFKQCLENYKKYSEWEHKLYELGIEFWERNEIQDMIGSFLDLLKYCCKDEDDQYDKYDLSNIDYFIYECDFGKEADNYAIIEEDGNEVKLKTSDDLWDYLVKNHPEIEDCHTHPTPIHTSDVSAISIDELTNIFLENYEK